jgi:hypothetical protein
MVSSSQSPLVPIVPHDSHQAAWPLLPLDESL